MLSPADVELCARDPALPGLAAALDAAALAEEAGLAGLRQTYLRYKPGTSAVATLAPADGSLRAYAAMTYTPSRYQEVRARPEWRDGRDPVLFLDPACTALVPMSRDREIKAAGSLSDPERLPACLARLGISHGELRLLRYKPGRRLVARVEDETGPFALIKSHTKAGFPRALSGTRHASSVSGLTLLGAYKRRSSLAVSWIAGHPLSAATSATEDFRATGAELARLHAAPAPDSGAPVAMDARWLMAEAEAVAVLMPHRAGAASRLAALLLQHVSAEDSAVCLLHGDFSADQVVVTASGPVVIDWDRATLGDPARDLGTFLARLDAEAIDGALAPDAAKAAGEALLEGYSARAGAVPAGVEPWRAAALFALATEAFRARRSDWPARIDAVLARSEALLAGARNGSVRGPSPGLAEALDVALMRPKLAAALGQSPESMVGLAAQLVRHKPGRRALIRYTFGNEPSSPVLGKLRAKGPDHRTPALHVALRAAGLDGGGPSRVGVPEMRGAIDDPPLWLQSEVPGRSLTACLLSNGGSEAARRAGRALALLHAADVPADRAWTLANELEVLARALGRAASELSDSMERIDALARQARAAAARLGRVPSTGIHRDFYPDQVVVDADTVWLLDLDLYARGDPLIDVANFLAHLTELGVRLRADPDLLAEEGRAFSAGYERERGALDPRRLGVLHWISLARHVWISRAHSDRRHTTRQLIDLCESGLQGYAPILTRSGQGEARGHIPRPPLWLQRCP